MVRDGGWDRWSSLLLATCAGQLLDCGETTYSMVPTALSVAVFPFASLSVLVPLRQTKTMAKNKPGKAKKGEEDKNEKLIANNRKARYEYEVLDTLECGIQLVGSEVKSLRQGRMSIDEAYGRVDRGEVWLVGLDIQEYTFANQQNHDPKRRRKLLMHRREIKKFAAQAYEKNLTLVPLKMYFKRGRAKVLMGICRGKKQYDKRESMKKRDVQRDIDRAMRARNS